MLPARDNHAAAPPSCHRKVVQDQDRSGGGGLLCVVRCAVPVDEHDVVVADNPGVVALGQRHHAAGSRLELPAVIHGDVNPTRRLVLKVRSLAPVGAGDRLDVVAPPPPGLQNEASDHPALHVQQLHPAVLEVSDLVGLAEVLVFDYLGRHCHGSIPFFEVSDQTQTLVGASSLSDPRISSRSSGPAVCPCTDTACSAAAPSTSSSSPAMVSVQFDSLGKSRQSATLRTAFSSRSIGRESSSRCKQHSVDSKRGQH